MWKEFRDFIARGNVIDLAVAVVLGGAFAAITTSWSTTSSMPWSESSGRGRLSLAVQVGNATVNYGLFIQAVVNFLIIAFVLFLIVRSYNRMRTKEPVPEPVTPEEVVLLREIRDLLEQRRV
jgi:large conductance mechanosensitive channel